MKNFVFKALRLIMMVAAPYISIKAFYEYISVILLHSAPSYPFGKEITDMLIVKNSKYLADYASEMLTIGIVFLTITAIIYLSVFIKTLINFAKAAIVLGLIFVIYYYLFK